MTCGGGIFAKNMGMTASQTVSGLPLNGGNIYVRLWTLFGAVWQYNDYTYIAATPAKAVMASPAPGATLSGSSATFTWTVGAGAAAYWLDVGPALGIGGYFAQNVGAVTSQMVTGLPVNGSTVYVRLWSLLAGVWQYNDYTYTASGGQSKAVMASPTPGATLSGASVTFSWSAGSGASAYWLDVGTAPGVGNYFALNVGLATSKSVTGLPVNGSAIYVRLWTQFGSVWQYNDYTYSAAAVGAPSKAVMTSPASGTTLGGSSVTFTWTAAAGAAAYWLDVGSALGVGSYFALNVGTVTSQTVTGLPVNGSAVYVRLWSLLAGAWQYNDYSYTASGGGTKAVITSPTPGAKLGGASVTFSWSADRAPPRTGSTSGPLPGSVITTG